MKCFTHQEENCTNSNCRSVGEGPNARADRLAGELFTAQMRLAEYEKHAVVIRWRQDGEFWDVEARLAARAFLDVDQIRAMAVSRTLSSAVAYALEELAKSIREAQR